MRERRDAAASPPPALPPTDRSVRGEAITTPTRYRSSSEQLLHHVAVCALIASIDTIMRRARRSGRRVRVLALDASDGRTRERMLRAISRVPIASNVERVLVVALRPGLIADERLLRRRSERSLRRWPVAVPAILARTRIAGHFVRRFPDSGAIRMCYDLLVLRSVRYRQAAIAFVFTSLWFVLGFLLLWSPLPRALGIHSMMLAAWLLFFFVLLAFDGVVLMLASLNSAFPPPSPAGPAMPGRQPQRRRARRAGPRAKTQHGD